MKADSAERKSRIERSTQRQYGEPQVRKTRSNPIIYIFITSLCLYLHSVITRCEAFSNREAGNLANGAEYDRRITDLDVLGRHCRRCFLTRKRCKEVRVRGGGFVISNGMDLPPKPAIADLMGHSRLPWSSVSVDTILVSNLSLKYNNFRSFI